jgi:DNA polymerase IV
MEEFATDPNRVAMRDMMKIWGVGRFTATELVKDYKTIAQVRAAVKMGKVTLDRNQYIGLLCYEDILEDMTRAEVESIFSIVEPLFKRRYPSVEMCIAGSYRRGKEACGDVDIFVTHPDFKMEVPPRALGEIVDELRMVGHIAYHLTFISGMNPKLYETLPSEIIANLTNPRRYGHRTTKSDNFSSSSYMGVFNSPVVPGKRRRVDIKFYPYRERVFARDLYFTGNGHFNRAMRFWASKKFGYTLNDHGLFHQHTSTRVMEAQCEREVFDKLQLAWKDVSERDCFDAVHSSILGGDNAFELPELNRAALHKESQEHAWVK